MFFLNRVHCQKNQSQNSILCEWSFLNGSDEKTSTEKILKPRLFFTYTPESLQKYFTVDDYMRCEGSLAMLNNRTELRIKLIFMDDMVEKQWGNIIPKATVTLNSIKGKSYTLSTEYGAVCETKKGLTVYTCNFQIPDNIWKKLKKFEIGSLLINFSRGFQTFEVNYIDFFIDTLI